MKNYKFIFWREIQGFEKKEEVRSEFIRYIGWVTGDSDAGTEQEEVDRLEQEFFKGATRGVVFDTNLDIPEGFFETRPTIKILYKNEVKEFKDKTDAIAFLKKEADGKEYKPGIYNPYGEGTRCLFNVWLIEHGCTRVVDMDSKIPEGFYD